MGKGGYLGGSTQLNSLGGGWSYDDASRNLEYENLGVIRKKETSSPTSKTNHKKKKQNSPFHKKYLNSLGTYARNCALREDAGKAWENPPKHVSLRHEHNEVAIKSAVLSSKAYKKAKSRLVQTTTSPKPQQAIDIAPKQPTAPISSDKQSKNDLRIASYARRAAEWDLKGLSWEKPNKPVQRRFGPSEANISKAIKAHPEYIRIKGQKSHNG